jgi:mRNA-degrading endonuclease RelE of RelBE toxin-antitoxin system
MNYRIVILPSAKADIKKAARRMRQYSREKANTWVDGIYEAINSLSAYPARCAVIPFGKVFDEEIRQLLYGKRREAYRILFTIQDEVIYVLCVLHHAQDIESNL